MSDVIAVTIDGPVASGKTSVGRLVARGLGIGFLDTGLMYRAVTYTALERGFDLSDHAALTNLAVNLFRRHGIDDELYDERLLAPRVNRFVSEVSMVSGVRRVLVDRQRKISEQGAIVMAGRDIGTVVLPTADFKIFLTASIEIRANRRYREIGGERPISLVIEDLQTRDRMDVDREDSPLRPADDAVIINTDNFTMSETVDEVLSIVKNYSESG